MKVNSNITAKELIEQLAEQGRYSFSSQEARQALKSSADATKLALNRLSHQGRIASPARGFYVIIPPEYRSLNCLPAEQFIPDLMNRKQLNYYVGLLSAAQYYGAAHQRPQEFQVFLAKNRRPIQCGKVRVKFIARKRIDDIPIQAFNTPRGTLRVSTPEATLIDLAGYPNSVGGFNQVATIVSELANEINPEALANIASTAPVTWSQRLGYVMDLVGQTEAAVRLRDYVSQHTREYATLIAGDNGDEIERSQDWKLIINAALEPDI